MGDRREGGVMDIPAQCQQLFDELLVLRGDLLEARQDLAQAVGSEAKRLAAATVRELEVALTAKNAELDRCRGCLDPLDATWEDPTGGFGVTIRALHPAVRPASPTVVSLHGDAFMRGLSFTFTGCGRESIAPRPGWSIDVSLALSTFTVARQFPDNFDTVPGFPWISVTTTPYTVSVTPIVNVRVLTGEFERTSGHVDLLCDVAFSWPTFGGPPARLNWLYRLDLGPSTVRTVFTTRGVDKTVVPGSQLLGVPLDAVRNLTLVAAGYLSGGLANTRAVEFTFVGRLAPEHP
jgi:hypothetical protein